MSALKNKTIAFDGKKALNNLTGIGNYSRFIINTLSQRNPDTRLMVYAPKAGNKKAMSCITDRENINIVLPTSLKRIFKEWWRCHGIVSDIKKSNVSLFHGLSNEIPFGINKCGIPVLVTVHDLIFLRYPKTFGFLSRNILKIKVKYACKHADKIITISEQTKKDLLYYYNIKEDKVRIIMQGCAEQFYQIISEQERNNIRIKYNLPEEYVLTVGTIEERKNHKTIIKAISRLNGVHLVIVSKKTRFQSELEKLIDELNVSDIVHIINGVTNQDLPAVYQSAKLCVYYSFYEGFGIPVLEGMASRIPVLAASGSCLEEVGGDACLYSSPFDVESLTDNMSKVLTDEKLRSDMVEKGIHRTKMFSTEEILGQIEACYEEMLE